MWDMPFISIKSLFHLLDVISDQQENIKEMAETIVDLTNDKISLNKECDILTDEILRLTAENESLKDRIKELWETTNA